MNIRTFSLSRERVDNQSSNVSELRKDNEQNTQDLVIPQKRHFIILFFPFPLFFKLFNSSVFVKL